MPEITVVASASSSQTTAPLGAIRTLAADPVDQPDRLRPRYHPCAIGNAGHIGPRTQAVLRRMAERFELCYTNALKSDPELRGRVELVVHLYPDGRVEQVRATSDPPALSLLPCMEAVVKSTRFPELCADFLIPIVIEPPTGPASTTSQPAAGPDELHL